MCADSILNRFLRSYQPTEALVLVVFIPAQQEGAPRLREYLTSSTKHRSNRMKGGSFRVEPGPKVRAAEQGTWTHVQGRQSLAALQKPEEAWCMTLQT